MPIFSQLTTTILVKFYKIQAKIIKTRGFFRHILKIRLGVRSLLMNEEDAGENLTLKRQI